MNQDELRRQMDLLAEDARQRSVGRRIAGITHTNTVTTVYKDGGEPEVYRTSSRLSTPNTVLKKKHGPGTTKRPDATTETPPPSTTTIATRRRVAGPHHGDFQDGP